MWTNLLLPPPRPPRTDVICACSPRNSRPIIPPAIGGRHTVHGKWGTDWRECDVKHSPDYCSGWAYVTTPRLGVRLAEMAANVDPGKMCLRLEDLFITGMLRERIEGKDG